MLIDDRRTSNERQTIFPLNKAYGKYSSIRSGLHGVHARIFD